jgi:membrane-associated phospholipid phosphatase
LIDIAIRDDVYKGLGNPGLLKRRTTQMRDDRSIVASCERKCAGVLLLGLSLAAAAHGQVQDTIANRSPFFTGRDALILGGFAAGTVAVAPLDRHFAGILQNPTRQENRFLRTSATAFRLLGIPGTIGAGLGLYVIGRVDDQHRVQDLGLHSLESVLLSTAVSGSMKMLAGRARPYIDIRKPHDFQFGRGFSDDDYQSFPSGHTTAAFAFAAAVSRETQMWWPRSRWHVGTVMYGGATLVGLSRMYNNLHWASDVLGGAAIGTLIGLKVVKYHHSHPDNAIDRALLKKNGVTVSTPIPLATVRFR